MDLIKYFTNYNNIVKFDEFQTYLIDNLFNKNIYEIGLIFKDVPIIVHYERKFYNECGYRALVLLVLNDIIIDYKNNINSFNFISYNYKLNGFHKYVIENCLFKSIYDVVPYLYNVKYFIFVNCFKYNMCNYSDCVIFLINSNNIITNFTNKYL